MGFGTVQLLALMLGVAGIENPYIKKSPPLYVRNLYIALISRLASSSWLEVLSWRFSLSKGFNSGSFAMFAQTSFHIWYLGLGPHCDVGWAASLCGKTWHGSCQRKHYKLTLVMLHPYCRHKASKKVPLLREK